MLDPKILDGDVVRVNRCQLGNANLPLTNAIHAKNRLEIRNTSIYQNMNSGVALGTDGGVTEITGSTIKSDVVYYSALYSGTLRICDVHSNVKIAGVQILEAKHGDITITDTQVTQNTTSFAHNKSYLVLHAFAEGATPNITVQSIAPSANMILRNGSVNAFTAYTNLSVIVEGDLTFEEIVTIANGCILTVTVGADDTLTVKKGFDAATSGSYVHTGGRLVGLVDLAVGGDLTLIDVVVTAEERVGSLGVGGNVTTVTLDGASVSADRIGALGEQNETFVFVVQLNGASFEGRLVSDLFRLDYVIDPSYDVSTLDTTLRSETTGNTTVYLPSIPSAPNPTDNFLFWYVLNEQDQMIALGHATDPNIASVAGLTGDHIAYAQGTNSDGTQTLLIYAFMNLTISGVIESGKLLNQNEFNSDEVEVIIYGNGKLTAMFSVNGSSLSGASYVLELQNSFPEGTVLTLGVMHLNIPVFYYYVCDGDESSIALSSFVRMGSESEAPRLLDVAAGTEIFDVLVVVVDFAVAEENGEVSNQVTLAVVVDSLKIADYELGYSTKEKATVTTTLEDTSLDPTVSVEFAGDAQFGSKLLYLVATVSGDTPIGYGATLTVGTTEATRIAQNRWFVSVGEAALQTMFEESYCFLGLDGGTYEVVWTLTMSDRNLPNVLGTELAISNAYGFAVQVEEANRLQIDRLLIDGIETNDRILTSGVEHTVLLVLTANREVTVILEIRNESGDFEQLDIEGIVENEMGSSITLPAMLQDGFYRITLSVDPDVDGADVYIPFILASK